MCLTEPVCGTDLGLLKTKAVSQSDGTYKISGQKIFITSGDHDLTENIIHLVLARSTDSPQGTKGISLFLVPKFLVNQDGSVGQRNGISTGSIETKMGIKGSATCVLNFDEATGYMIGPKDKGLNAMFTMVNIAFKPLSLGPIIYPVASSKFKTQVAEPLIPIFVSIDPVDIPFLCPTDPSWFTKNLGTKNKLIPFVPWGESVDLANTKWIIFSVKSWSPDVIKIFWPLIL